MALGSVKHSRRNVTRASYRQMSAIIGKRMSDNSLFRHVRVDVSIHRMHSGRFNAVACVRRGDKSSKRCAHSNFGSSPTAVTKKALHALARKLK